jgi:histidine triad (HIT) family protein
MRGCPFCAIAAGEAAAEILLEDDLVIAFLDLHPIRPGHSQIIPRAHLPCFEDLPPPTAARILGTGQRLARALKALFPVPRVAFMFTGTDVAHAHAHLVPMQQPTDITSPLYIAERPLTFRSAPRAGAAELALAGARLRQALGAAAMPPHPAAPGAAS